MTKTTETHVPPPWQLDSFGEDMKTQTDQLLEGVGTDREWIQIQDVHPDGGEVVALAHPTNAAFIVRAVNSHAALVEALEACSDALQRATNGDEYGEYETEIAQARTVALLAKEA